MADVSDPKICEAVADVRDDHTPTNWCAIGYEGKAKLVFVAKGSDGHAGLTAFLQEDKVTIEPISSNPVTKVLTDY